MKWWMCYNMMGNVCKKCNMVNIKRMRGIDTDDWINCTKERKKSIKLKMREEKFQLLVLWMSEWCALQRDMNMNEDFTHTYESYRIFWIFSVLCRENFFETLFILDWLEQEKKLVECCFFSSWIFNRMRKEYFTFMQ